MEAPSKEKKSRAIGAKPTEVAALLAKEEAVGQAPATEGERAGLEADVARLERANTGLHAAFEDQVRKTADAKRAHERAQDTLQFKRTKVSELKASKEMLEWEVQCTYSAPGTLSRRLGYGA